MWTEAYVNGEKTEIVTKGAYNAAGAGLVIDAAGVYKADKTNDKDQITAVTSVIDKSATIGTADVKAGSATVTGFSASACDVKITVVNAGTTSSTITINGSAYTSGNCYTIAATGTLTVVVTVTDGSVSTAYTYTITVS